MKQFFAFFICLPLLFCSPKGPVTYKSSFVGQTKAYLIHAKGVAKTIKVFDNSEAYIYKEREEYYGKKTPSDTTAKPKRAYITEHIYYINDKGIVYKYQVWKKKVKLN